MKMRFRLISALLTISLLLSAFSTISFAEGTLIGDINKNGQVETDDARAILKMAAGILASDIALADMDSNGEVSVEDAVLALKKAADIGGVVIPDKNGENYLSDSPNNEFIELVASSFNRDKAALVAIYSVPDSGTNYVLEFKKGFGSSKYEKSPKNLYRVYHIGAAPQRKISFTDGSVLSGNDHNYNCEPAEGILVFNLVKTKVMEQYPDYFVGLK